MDSRQWINTGKLKLNDHIEFVVCLEVRIFRIDCLRVQNFEFLHWQNVLVIHKELNIGRLFGLKVSVTLSKLQISFNQIEVVLVVDTRWEKGLFVTWLGSLQEVVTKLERLRLDLVDRGFLGLSFLPKSKNA